MTFKGRCQIMQFFLNFFREDLKYFATQHSSSDLARKVFSLLPNVERIIPQLYFAATGCSILCYYILPCFPHCFDLDIHSQEKKCCRLKGKSRFLLMGIGRSWINGPSLVDKVMGMFSSLFDLVVAPIQNVKNVEITACHGNICFQF